MPTPRGWVTSPRNRADSTDEYLVLTLTPDATAADARQLWCEVLLDVEGGWIEVRQDDEVFRPPGRGECADLAPTP